MKRLRQILLVMVVTIMLPASAYANMGPTIVLQFSIHLVILTWLIGFGEGLLLCTLLRAWRSPSWKKRIFISMIAANITSAWLGMLFVKSSYAAQIMGDVTIDNLISAFWTMVYVTFVLTMIIEFPFFLLAVYGEKWLLPKAVVITIFVHCLSYSLLFFFYSGEESISMVTGLEMVPATTFEIKEDYDLYYISPDGKYVLRSDLAGNDKEVIATLNMDGVPDRLCTCPRKVIEESAEGTDKKGRDTVQRVCWESGFDLYVLMNVKGEYQTKLLLENFSLRSAVYLWDGEYKGGWDSETDQDFRAFRTFGDAKEWQFYSWYWDGLSVYRVRRGDQPYTTKKKRSSFTQESEKNINISYTVNMPIIQWRIRNGTHIAGDYAVFKLGKDQICIMDPEKKRIALIARGFGPVVAKPHAETPPDEVKK